jgi:hypothetical protein
MVLAFTVKCLFHQKLRRSNQSVAVVATCTNFPFQIWMTGWTTSLDTNKHHVSLQVTLQYDTLIINLI